MKNWIILILSVALFASCSVRRDRERIELAEALLYTNRDSAELLLRQVERPERLDDAHLAKYWFVMCDLHANSMQSLSEDSMICWAADYFRHQWVVAVHKLSELCQADQSQIDELNLFARWMMLTGLEEAMYWWWNGEKDKAQEVLQRQKQYADEVAEVLDNLTAGGTPAPQENHIWQVVTLRVSAELAMRDYDYERVRDYTEMLIAMDDGKAIHLDEVERVYNALAIVYFSLGEYEKMELYFEKAIANASDSVFIADVVRRNYADLLGEIGQTDRAIRMQEDVAAAYREADNWLLVESLCSLSRLWLNKGDKQRADRYMREAEALFEKHKESAAFDPATEAALLAHRQVLNYALNGNYQLFPLTQYNNRWSENDYVRFRIAEAKERSMRDLRERNLYLTISRQRQILMMIAIIFLALGIIVLVWSLSRRRKRMLMEKEEEIETMRSLLNANSASTESVQQLMLRQLGIIKTIAGTPTEANQHLLAQLTALDENKAAALIDWQSIYQTIDGAYANFYTRLIQEHGEVLNEKEIQLCCLLRAGFSTKEINMLTRQSLQTIYQRKTQVRQKLGLAEGDDIAEKLS